MPAAMQAQGAVTSSAQDQQEKPEKPEKQPEAQPETPTDQQAPKAEKPKEHEKEGQAGSQPSKAEPGQSGEQNGKAGRPAGKSAHIPDDKFKGNFGRTHSFTITHSTMVNNQAAFQYGGYTFILLNPWPSEWAYTDDCYIDYVDGEYFLFDLLHPGVRVALFVEI
jgi:hypothetical protein